MCGIAGILDPAGGTALPDRAAAMARRLHHRGPDGSDVWTDPEAGIALGHRRLAIIDLSPAGPQPMISSCGRMVLSYNGEIYNAAELRTELEAGGRVFRGHSDSEVIVEGAAEWGLAALLPRLIGMFALALWDRRERRLSLVRDRFGIKPLYWSYDGACLRFGSELKALTAEPGFDRTIDRDALASYLRFCYVPSPQSIYRAARKLPAGHVLEISPAGAPRIDAWWRLADLVRSARAAPFTGSKGEATEALEELLKDAVKRRMYADVPLGVFLSGGVDSATVTALMQAQSDRPVQSFTVGFSETGYDEAAHAAQVAAHLGTDHTEEILTPDAARAVIPDMPAIFDEPFADSSQIPTLLVSQITRRQVTVALSGDGGDEIFGGYNRHIEADGRLKRLWSLPGPLRRSMATGAEWVPPAWWRRLLPGLPQPDEKAAKLAQALRAGPECFYRTVVSTWPDPAKLTLAGDEDWHEAWGEAETLCPDPVERMQYLDAMTYMSEDILAKVDRTSMAVSLEVRVPLMDHRVAAFAWSLPMHLKTAGGQGKRILRRVLYRHVPRNLIERPKQGFQMPIGHWLRDPLRSWAEDLLSEAEIKAHGLVRSGPVRAIWDEHLSGRRDHAARLWTVLNLQAFAQNLAPPPAAP